jgi:hypothetical protein
MDHVALHPMLIRDPSSRPTTLTAKTAESLFPGETQPLCTILVAARMQNGSPAGVYRAGSAKLRDGGATDNAFLGADSRRRLALGRTVSHTIFGQSENSGAAPVQRDSTDRLCLSLHSPPASIRVTLPPNDKARSSALDNLCTVGPRAMEWLVI